MSRDCGVAVRYRTGPEDLLEHFDTEWFRGQRYRHLSDERHGVERGTALVGDVIVRGYPSMPRALVLEPAIRETFDGPVAIEEKLNGYNVELHGSTATSDDHRSGFVAETRTLARAGRDFSTGHARQQCSCGELVGPENPYTDHDYSEVDEVGFYVFGIRHRETGTPMGVERRLDQCTTYGLDSVGHYGTFTPTASVDAARERIDDLNARGREGVVLKRPTGRRR